MAIDLQLNRFHYLCCILWHIVLVFNGHMIFAAFYLLPPEQYCLDSNFNYTTDSCHLSVQQKCQDLKSCKEIEMTAPPFGSAVVEFDMMCDRSYYAVLLSTIQFIGVSVGAIVYGHLADHYGRKPITLIGIVSGIVAAAANSFVQSWELFALCRFVIGTSMACLYAVFYTCMLEFILPRQRVFMKTIFGSCPRIFFTLLCWICGWWRSATIATSFLLVPVLLAVTVMPESPIWYRSKKRFEEARRADARIAWLAGQKSTEIAREEETGMKTDERVYTVKDLFSERKLAANTVIIGSLWFCASLTAYSSDLNSGALGSFYVTHFVAGFATLAVKIVVFFLDACWPSFNRRHLHQIPQSVVTLSFLLLTLILVFFPKDNCVGKGWNHWIVIAVNIIGISFKDIVWDSIYLTAPEVFPTKLRAVGIGFCSVMARIGAILAPQIVYLSQFSQAAPYGAMTLASMLSLLVSCLFLPDTKGLNFEQKDKGNQK